MDASFTSYPGSLKKFPLEWLQQDQSYRLTHVAIGFGVVETLFVALFFYSRIKIQTVRSLDAYLLIPAYIFTFSHVIMAYLFVHIGRLGHHWPALTLSQQVTALKLEAAIAMLNGPAITLPKLSILAMYLRVFSTKTYRYACYLVAASLVAAWVIYMGVSIGSCKPLAYQWDKSIPGGHCMNQFPLFIWFAVPHIVTDLAVIAIPLPVIWRLQTSRNQKIGLTITFLTGSVGIFTAIVRFAVFLRLLSAKNHPEEDLSWIGVDIIIWMIVEPGLYLIAACLPSLRPLFNPVFREFDMEAIRTRFRIMEPKNLPDGTEDNRRDIQLSGITGNATSSITAGPRSPRVGFVKLNEPKWPERAFTEEAKNTGLATCYRERDSEDSEGGPSTSQTELQRGQYSYGIVVQKEFTISREPV